MENKNGNYDISAPALHAAHTILQHFDLHQKPGGKVIPTERNLAILIDVCTDVFRIQIAVKNAVTKVSWQDKNELARNLEALQDSLRALEMVHNRMPRFRTNEMMTTIAHKQSIDEEMIKAKIRENSHIARALGDARTVEEEQRVLKQAGIVR